MYDKTNKYNLKYKVLRDLYTFLTQSIHLKYINFNKINNISSFNKCKCLILSKNISIYLRENDISQINNTLLFKIIKENIKNKHNLKLYKKNIELIKFYTILFSEKSLSHLTFYLFNNSKISMMNENKECLSIIIKNQNKTSIILNEHLNVFSKKYVKKNRGDIFIYKYSEGISSGIKYKLYLSTLSIIVVYLILFNIPNNYIIMEMNMTIHMKMNQNGYILSYRPKTPKARTMIKQNKQVIRTLNHSIPSFIDYGLNNNILKPGSYVKIYVIGPPLKAKFLNRLEDYNRDKNLNITINNSGNMVKINGT